MPAMLLRLIKGVKMNRELLKNIYLEWRNDFLTVERFSEYHGLTVQQGSALIDLARNVFNSPHPEK